jgi:hypothetical protein
MQSLAFQSSHEYFRKKGSKLSPGPKVQHGCVVVLFRSFEKHLVVHLLSCGSGWVSRGEWREAGKKTLLMADQMLPHTLGVRPISCFALMDNRLVDPYF